MDWSSIGDISLLSTLIVIFLLVLFVRAAAVALEMTGRDKKTALFQALSAFSRTGFTTQEAESIVNHLIRRKIAFLLMVLGTAGFATVIITSTAHIVTREDYWLPIDVLILAFPFRWISYLELFHTTC